MSTSRDPHTDGSSEIMNRMLENYLRFVRIARIAKMIGQNFYPLHNLPTTQPKVRIWAYRLLRLILDGALLSA
jgi:hypothetical protein